MSVISCKASDASYVNKSDDGSSVKTVFYVSLNEPKHAIFVVRINLRRQIQLFSVNDSFESYNLHLDDLCRRILVITHLYTTLCTTSLKEVDPIVLVDSTFIGRVVHKMVYKCGMPSIAHFTIFGFHLHLMDYFNGATYSFINIHIFLSINFTKSFSYKPQHQI